MPNTFTIATFQPLVGQSFSIGLPDLPADLVTLAEVSPLATEMDSRRVRDPFRLMFRALPGRVLPQAIYNVRNETLGEMAIFLVPVSSDSGGVQYEAIFT